MIIVACHGQKPSVEEVTVRGSWRSLRRCSLRVGACGAGLHLEATELGYLATRGPEGRFVRAMFALCFSKA